MGREAAGVQQAEDRPITERVIAGSASHGRLPLAGHQSRAPKTKTALSGAASRQRHKVSSRSRGWGGSRVTSSNAHIAHHEHLDVSGCAESQGPSRVFPLSLPALGEL